MSKETRRSVVKLEVEKKSGHVYGQACSEYEAPRGFIFVSAIKEAEYEGRLDWRTQQMAWYEINGTCRYFYMDGGTPVELFHGEFGWIVPDKYVKAEVKRLKAEHKQHMEAGGPFPIDYGRN